LNIATPIINISFDALDPLMKFYWNLSYNLEQNISSILWYDRSVEN